MAKGRLTGTGSGRFGGVAAGKGGFSIEWDVREFRNSAGRLIALINQEEQKFRGGAFQLALTRAHEAAAEKIQDGMVRELKDEIAATGRPQVARDGQRNRLARSIADPRNADITATAFMVGRESWLDQSPAALYWRQIEQGNPKIYHWRGLFTTNFSKWYGPSQDRFREEARFPQSASGPGNYLKKGATVDVGPFPAYEFSAGGMTAWEALDMEALYRKHLGNAGIKLSDVLRK